MGDRKLSGILGEATSESVVVGLGRNVNWGDDPPPPRGVALDELVGHPVDRSLDALLRHLDARLAWPPDQLLADYRTRSATLGRRVTVELWAGTIEGEAVDLPATATWSSTRATAAASWAAGDVVHVRPAG